MIFPSEIILSKPAEEAAIASLKQIGRGDNMKADKFAVEAMRASLNELDISGEIKIGEGERDKAPMLFIGEKVGKGGLELDIALDPLEGTTICAEAGNNSLSVIAYAKKGNFLNAPDVYMDKIAIGSFISKNIKSEIINLDNSIKKNLANLAKAKDVDISDLTAIILKRSRHEELIAKIREAGAKVKLISDGDIAAIISVVCVDRIGDIYMGQGGAPEGVLAAAALKTFGGEMMGRLVFNGDSHQIQRAKKMGIADLTKQYGLNDMVKGDAIFVACGVTDGDMLKGVKKVHSGYEVETLITNSLSGTIRKILTYRK